MCLSLEFDRFVKQNGNRIVDVVEEAVCIYRNQINLSGYSCSATHLRFVPGGPHPENEE